MSSNPTTHTIAIAGFTGRMAHIITDSLLANHPEVTIHGVSRNPDKVDTALRSKANINLFQATSNDTEALRRGLEGADTCICCYLGDNTLMTDGQKTLIDACVAAGVERYVASDWFIDYRNLQLGDHPSKDPMILTLTYVEEKEKEGRLAGVHVLCGAFTECVLTRLHLSRC